MIKILKQVITVKILPLKNFQLNYRNYGKIGRSVPPVTRPKIDLRSLPMQPKDMLDKMMTYAKGQKLNELSIIGRLTTKVN